MNVLIKLAISMGMLSYAIFFLGILHILYPINIGIALGTWIICIVYISRKDLFSPRVMPDMIRHLLFYGSRIPPLRRASECGMTSILLLLLMLQSLVNLVGVLGPELAFDALWYHLTLPKIYLHQHAVSFIPGGLLYYSAMPKLGEMLYVIALSLFDEIAAKGIQFAFGIFTCIALYSFAKELLPKKFALFAVIVFYANCVVAWESTIAYIDLIRTFYEIMALWMFVRFYKTKKLSNLLLASVFLGFAITTKLLAVGSLFIFIILLASLRYPMKRILVVIGILSLSLLIPLPCFVFSYVSTGNPVYPFFTSLYNTHIVDVTIPFGVIGDMWSVLTRASDPVSPVYVIFLPLVIVFFKKFSKETKIVLLYCFIALIVWCVTPRTGGGRFLLPYLPAFSLAAAAVLQAIHSKRIFYLTAVGIVFLVSLSTIVYRGIANARYLSVIVGKETKQEFLSSHLNFAFGDFYDTDGFFKKTIGPQDKVLLVGFHNLYYVDFPFIDSSWRKEGDIFRYVAVQNTPLPKEFGLWKKIYDNKKTGVVLYKKPHD